MLTVWGRKTSSNVQALMWCVGELGLSYKRHDIGHRYGGNDTPSFLKMTPNGTVPVLRDGDGPPLWETGAIVRYLCSRYASSPFWPQDLPARAQVDMWAEWAKINVALAFTSPIFWRVVRTPPKDMNWPAIRGAITALGKKLDIAEARLQTRAFICGDDLTLADVQLGHVLYRYFDIPIERPEHLALQRHVMVSYDELRAA